MKLKELPSFLRRSWQLARIPAAKLNTSPAYVETNLIISLTSIEARLSTLHLVIRSLLSQNQNAELIVLWLHKDLESKIPLKLQKLLSARFEIRFSDESCPHRKLVEPMRHLPGKKIVTCDDDMLYHADWLERLLQAHRETPNEIVAHECRKILKNNDGDIRPYAEWVKEAPGESHDDTISIGYGGVLYPQDCLPSETLDKETYLRLTPRADDLWIKAMSMKAGTRIRRSKRCEPMPIPILGTQRVALKRQNIGGDENRSQWRALQREYDLLI